MSEVYCSFVTDWRDKYIKNGIANFREYSPSWEADSSSASRAIPHILRILNFLVIYTIARYLSLSKTDIIHPQSSCSFSLTFTLILSSNLRRDIPRILLPSAVSISTLYIIIFSDCIILNNDWRTGPGLNLPALDWGHVTLFLVTHTHTGVSCCTLFVLSVRTDWRQFLPAQWSS